MPQAVLQKVGAAGVPQLLLSAAPRLATTLTSNKLSIKVTSSSGSGTYRDNFSMGKKWAQVILLTRLMVLCPK